MSLPKAPVVSRQQTMEWMSTAPEDIRDPEFLWGECWERFNTIQMPIASTKEYFDIAIRLASTSNDRHNFEKLFQQTMSRRKAEVTKWYAGFKRNAWRDGQSFPCGSARVAAVEFCRTGSLNSVLQLLDGIAYGWKNDECLVVGAPIEPLSDDGSEIPQTQFWDEEEYLWYGAMKPADTPAVPCATDRDASEAPSQTSTTESSNSWHRQPPSSSLTAKEHLGHLPQPNVDAKCEHYTESENASKKRMRSDDAVQADDEPSDYNLFPSYQPTASTQRVSGYPLKKRRRLREDNTKRTEASVVSDQAASGHRIRKRIRTDDDCNNGRGLERQRPRKRTSMTANSTTSAKVSDGAPINNEKESLDIEPVQAVVDNMPRKRPKTDVADNDDERHRRKPRKLTMTKAEVNSGVKAAATNVENGSLLLQEQDSPGQHIECQIYEEDWPIYALGAR